jgi:hypothetical protein
MGQLVFQANAGGQTALVGPNPSTSISINIPATNGNMVTTGDSGTVTSTMLASSVYTAPGTIGSGTPNTGAFTSLSSTSGTLNGSIGATTANTGAFTTLSASSTVSGTGFSTYLASPPAIGGTAPSTGAFTTLTLTNALAVAQGGTGVTTSTGSGANVLGTSPTLTTPTVATIKSAASVTPTVFQDSAGTEIGTLCRAWVTFNGSTTATIQASFNVSSVTYSTTGIYVVNFTNTLTNTNGAAVANAGVNSNKYAFSCAATNVTATEANVGVTEANGAFTNDATFVSFAVFR